ncbi:MAG TPA: V-type ATPase subunit [bacterium]|nr:V-type ATPase subunit [bacterium]
MEWIEFQEDDRYVFAVARVRAMEARMLDDYFLSRLTSESPDGAMRLLSDSVYRDVFAGIERLEDFAPALEDHLKLVFDELQGMAAEPALIQSLRARYDYHNLGPVFMAFVRKTPLDAALLSKVGNVPVIDLASAVERQEDSLLREFFGAIWDKCLQVWNELPEIQAREKITVLLDDAYWESMTDEASHCENALLRRYYTLRLQWENLERIVRQMTLYQDGTSIRIDLFEESEWGNDVWRRLGVTPLDQLAQEVPMSLLKAPFAETLSLLIQEKRMDGFLTGRHEWLKKLLETTSYVSFGPEPLIAFALKKEMEADRIRAALIRILYPVSKGQQG